MQGGVPGHDETGALPSGTDWDAIAAGSHTLVLFMGLSSLDAVAIRLLAGGRQASEPVLVVARASMPDERVLRTSLGSATLDVARAALPSPALVIIGAVAGDARAVQRVAEVAAVEAAASRRAAR